MVRQVTEGFSVSRLEGGVRVFTGVLGRVRVERFGSNKVREGWRLRVRIKRWGALPVR